MTCYNPLSAWLRNDFEDEWTRLNYPRRREYVDSDGNLRIDSKVVLFTPNHFWEKYFDSHHLHLFNNFENWKGSQNSLDVLYKYYEPVELPCGKCVGCRIAHTKEMSARAWFEAQQYNLIPVNYVDPIFGNKCVGKKLKCSFITLTISPEYMEYRSKVLGFPENKLYHKEFQDFMKRLRKRVGKVRYFMAGEYGSKNGRPHYHAIIYGYDFPDKKVSAKTATSYYYSSNELQDLWTVKDKYTHEKIMSMGFVSVGDVTKESCSYVARYVLKKLEDGTFDGSYTKMSTNPGIGFAYLEHNLNNIVNLDYINTGKYIIKPPRYYDNKIRELYPEYFEEVLQPRRREHALKVSADLPKTRLKELEKIANEKIKILKRKDNF